MGRVWRDEDEQDDPRFDFAVIGLITAIVVIVMIGQARGWWV